MKSFLSILFILFSLLNINSQDISQKEIFLSKKYYFFKAYGKDTLQLKEEARRGLIDKISEEMKGESLNNINKIELDNIQFKIITLIDEVKVIAYIKKDDIYPKTESKNIQVIRIVEKKEEVKSESEVVNKPKEKKIDVENKDKIKENIEVEKTQENIAVNAIALNDNEKIILTDLLKQSDVKSFIKTLDKYSNQGLLQYVTSSNYFNSHSNDGFFIALFDKKNVINTAILYKEGGEFRKDLKNNREFKMKNLNKYYQLWIKVL